MLMHTRRELLKMFEATGIAALVGNAGAPLRLGTRDRISFLTGGLDEVAVYPRVGDDVRS
jgi:hypothetical protein